MYICPSESVIALLDICDGSHESTHIIGHHVPVWRVEEVVQLYAL
jgi:hypothetical protein